LEKRTETLLLLLLVVLVVFVAFGSNISGRASKRTGEINYYCSDSDGGIIPLVYGIVRGANVNGSYTIPDNCASQSVLWEAYCTSENNGARINIDCRKEIPNGVCQSGRCVYWNVTPSNGTAYFTSVPESGAWVESSSGVFWGYTPFSRNFAPGTYSAQARKFPFYQNWEVRTFNIFAGQNTYVEFILNQTHHSINNTNGTCLILDGTGPIVCRP